MLSTETAMLPSIARHQERTAAPIPLNFRLTRRHRMLICDHEDYVELSVAEREYHPAGAGDTLFSVSIRVTAMGAVFSADAPVWVSLPQILLFATQLRALDEHRDGAAILESISPGEMRLELRSTDTLGHMAAVGQVGRWSHRAGGSLNWLALTFTISLDPSNLSDFTAEFEQLAAIPHP